MPTMTSEASATVAIPPSDGAELTVCVGAPVSAGALPDEGPLLVIEADSERAQNLRHILRGRADALVCEEVLVAENQEEVVWHRFNDGRLDGPEDVSFWQDRFPNLRSVGVERRCGRRLEEILDGWSDHQASTGAPALHLVLRQGDPLAVLRGLGERIQQVQTIQLNQPRPEAKLQHLRCWLSEQGLREDSLTPAKWKRDPIASMARLLEEKEREQQTLIATNQQLTSLCQAMQVERDNLAAKLEQICQQCEELSRAQVAALAEKQQKDSETDALQREREALRQDYERLASDNAAIAEKLAAASQATHNSREACKKLLPIQLYQAVSTDLAELNEEELLHHYIEHGQFESRIQTSAELWHELKMSRQQNEEAKAKIYLLQNQFDLVNQQLEVFKDLFARLVDKQHSSTEY